VVLPRFWRAGRPDRFTGETLVASSRGYVAREELTRIKQHGSWTLEGTLSGYAASSATGGIRSAGEGHCGEQGYSVPRRSVPWLLAKRTERTVAHRRAIGSRTKEREAMCCGRRPGDGPRPSSNTDLIRNLTRGCSARHAGSPAPHVSNRRHPFSGNAPPPARTDARAGQQRRVSACRRRPMRLSGWRSSARASPEYRLAWLWSSSYPAQRERNYEPCLWQCRTGETYSGAERRPEREDLERKTTGFATMAPVEPTARNPQPRVG